MSHEEAETRMIEAPPYTIVHNNRTLVTPIHMFAQCDATAVLKAHNAAACTCPRVAGIGDSIV